MAPPNDDTPGWRGPAQIPTVNEGEGKVAVRFPGETLDRPHQEVRAHVPYLVYLSAFIGHEVHQWNIVRRDVESLSPPSLTVGVVFQQFGWHITPTCAYTRLT